MNIFLITTYIIVDGKPTTAYTTNAFESMDLAKSSIELSFSNMPIELSYKTDYYPDWDADVTNVTSNNVIIAHITELKLNTSVTHL